MSTQCRLRGAVKRAVQARSRTGVVLHARCAIFEVKASARCRPLFAPQCSDSGEHRGGGSSATVPKCPR